MKNILYLIALISQLSFAQVDLYSQLQKLRVQQLDSEVGGDVTDPVAGALSYANITYNTAELTISATDNVGVTSIDVYVNSTYNTTVNNSNLSSYLLNGLVSNTAYSVYVIVKDAANNIDTSNTVNFTTLTSVPASEPPIFTNITNDNVNRDRIYFDSSEVIVGTTTTGFFIGNGLDVTVSNLTIDGDGLGGYLTLSRDLTYWDNNALRYEGGSNITAGSYALIPFTLSYITNIISEPTALTYRYVTTAATGSGNGLSEGSAWTLSQAFTNASAGMTIWIKSGNYGNQNLILSSSGIDNSPIKFIGYKNTINDITSNYYDYGVTWDTSEMPTLTGTSEITGEAITLSGVSYVVFRNIQITNYSRGFTTAVNNNSNNVFERLNGHTFGSDDSSGGSIYASFIDFAVQAQNDPRYYSYNAPYTGNDNMKFIDMRIVNASMGNLICMGWGGNLIDGVKSYSDRTTEPSRLDYHITTNGHNNIIRNCYAENFNSTTTNVSTHGIGIRGAYNWVDFDQAGSMYNLIEKSTAINTSEPFYFRNFKTDYNVVKDCDMGTNADTALHPNGYGHSNGIAFYGGVQYNIAERLVMSNGIFGVTYLNDGGEDGSTDNTIAQNNLVRNCIITDTLYPFEHTGDNANELSKDNTVINCTVDKARFIYRSFEVDLQNFQLINCNITNVEGIPGLPANYYSIGSSYANCNFFNNKDNWHEIGNGNINADPLYTDATNGDYSPLPGSPSIGSGQTNALSMYDLYNYYRSVANDIGAIEFNPQ